MTRQEQHNHDFKIGDKVTYASSKKRFIFFVASGKTIAEENFSEDGIATIQKISRYGSIMLEEVVKESGSAYIEVDEVRFIKHAGTGSLYTDKTYTDKTYACNQPLPKYTPVYTPPPVVMIEPESDVEKIAINALLNAMRESCKK